ncbi:MAG: putative glycosyltransferase [Nocardioides sp.]|nr:putative glycosyltransferase [Nocardioides sp.]
MSVSIDLLLPFYGPPHLMRVALKSVLAQDDPDWRLHVVDDCHPDLSVRDFVTSLDDRRVTYRRNEHNLGANLTYRHALERSTADVVVFFGADDVMLPHYVRTLRRTLESHPGAAVVQPGVEVIDEVGRPALGGADRIKKRLRPGGAGASTLSGQGLAASLLRGNWTYFPSLAWDRALVDEIGFRSYGVVQDLALLVDVAVAGGSLVIDPEVTFRYRRHRASDSSVRAATGGRFNEERDYFDTIARELDVLEWDRAARSARVRLTSRANALAHLVPAVRARSPRAVGSLLRHALSR